VWERNGIDRKLRVVFIPVLALVIFNLVQWESWLGGFQTVMYLAMFCIVTGFILLGENLNWTRWALAAGLGVVAIFSSSNALLYAPIGLGLIFVGAKQSERVWMGALWCVVFAVTIGLYFWGWRPTVIVPPINILYNPIPFGRWLVNFLGAEFLSNRFSQYFGAVSLGLVLWFVYQARAQRKLGTLLPLWALLLFILASGVIIDVGRYAEDVYHGLVSRYITLTAWYWAALFILFTVLVKRPRLHVAVMLGIVVLLGVSTLQGAATGIRVRYLETLPTYVTIRSGQTPSDSELLRIHGVEPAIVRERLAGLCERQWSVCR
jgi:hypothetical protein